jgi:3-oxoacyl-[acyl-carrier protein] reductase
VSQCEILGEKTVLVTGGCHGIGRYIAEAFVTEGATVIVTCPDARSCENAGAKLVGCEFIICDQRDPLAIDRMACDIQHRHRGVDILVANAGIIKSSPVVETSLEDWKEILDVNLTGTFLMIKALLPSMINKQKGDIFLMGSMAGKVGVAGLSAYCASKFGIQGLAQALNHEVRCHNIRTSVLNPGTVAKRADGALALGKGVKIHASDVARLIVSIASLPSRVMVRDVELWETNP